MEATVAPKLFNNVILPPANGVETPLTITFRVPEMVPDAKEASNAQVRLACVVSLTDKVTPAALLNRYPSATAAAL